MQYERGKPYVMYESDHKVQYSMYQKKKKERNLVLLTFLPVLLLQIHTEIKREALAELKIHLQLRNALLSKHIRSFRGCILLFAAQSHRVLTVC